MKSYVFDDLQDWAAEELKKSRCAELIDSGLIDRMRADLGGSHTVVTYPPLDTLVRLDHEKVLASVRPVSVFNLYAHIAFCEFLCPFCHYDTEHTKIGAGESEKARVYFQSLEIEIAGWKQLLKGSALGSLYIGGGTPTAASEDRLLSILEAVESFPREEGFVACVETSPLTTVARDGKAKLRALARRGVNRFSIGVQSFNPDLLRRTRGHSLDKVTEALEILREFENVNIDLMQDLPGQEDAHVIEDLKYVDHYRPAQVTWYIFRVRPEAAWYSRYSRSALELSDSIGSVRKSLIIREGMARLGYRAMPGGRFVREEKFRDRFKDIRAGLSTTLVGVGVSAYSHGWGYMFRNAFSRWGVNGIDSYNRLVRTTGFGIETGLPLSEVELAASALVSGIRTGVAIPESSRANEAYVSFAKDRLSRLEAAGLVEKDSAGRYSLTRLGSLFEEEVCAQFYSPAIQARLKELNSEGPVNKAGPPVRLTRNKVTAQVIH